MIYPTPQQLRMIEESARLAGVPEPTIASAVAGDRAALLEMTESIERFTARLERAERLYLESLPPLARLIVEVRWWLASTWSRIHR